MSKKFFANINTLEELKKEYRRLAFTHHPDKGGNAEEMKALNNEYELLFAILKDKHETKTNTTMHETASDFMYIINNIINCQGIEIEICGNWIWISGDTYPHKTILKDNNFLWASSKKQWYWKPEDYVKKSKKSLTMDKIRELYGSERVNTKQAFCLV